MRKLFICMAMPLLMAALPMRAERTVSDFDSGWKFSLSDDPQASKMAYNDSSWRSLNLPHDWSIEGENLQDNPGGGTVGYFPTGTGWYRKTFTVSNYSSERKYFIEFDGVYMNSTVWLNGVCLGNRPYGYVNFSYDMTPYLRRGRNVIAVRVDNSQQPNSRWYSGSGIYRDVKLVSCERTHFEKWGVFAYTDSVNENGALVKVRSTAVNEDSGMRQVTVVNSLIDASGNVVAKESTEIGIASSDSMTVEQEITVPSPELWGIDSPYLYTLRSEIVAQGKVIDSTDTDFGIRTIEYDVDRGFFLNGEHIKMRGINTHHDAGGLGAAVPQRVWERRLELLKESGCNAIRTSHNPPSEEFLELCDRMGFLVMDEAFDEWESGKNKFSYQLYFSKWWEKDLLAMVLRDRNHPSVVMWSVGNEVPDQSTERGPQLARKLIALCHANDPTRLVTCGNDRIAALNGATEAYLDEFNDDIQGYNYPDRWRERREIMYYPDKAAHPQRRVVATESSGLGGLRGDYQMGQDPSKISASYGGNRLVDVEQRWRFTTVYDYVIGDFMWTGIDNYGESGWPSRVHTAGYLDNCGFRKDGFYFFKSLWTDDPTLHIYPHWNWPGREGQVMPVICYTNCESVELFVNGKSYGRKSLEFPRKGVELGWNRYGEGKVYTSTADLHLSWDVVYEPGEIVAVGIKNGKEYRHRIVTTGEPYSIRLSADRTEFTADPDDVSHVTVEILDKAGNVVPTADNMVRFTIEGASIIGVENGNARDLDSCKVPQRKAFNGLCLAIVQADKPGSIRISASSDGLAGDELLLNATLPR